MNKISNMFWGWFAPNECDKLNIKGIIKILGEYNKIENIPVLTDMNGYVVPCHNNVYAVKDKTGNIYDIYYKNLHFHMVDTEPENVFQIFVKPDDEDWNIIKKGNQFDVSNPETKNVEVYYWFDIETMHEFRCSHSAYRKGSWNQYLVNTLNEFEDIINNLTVESYVSNAYKNYNKKNNIKENDESEDC